MNEVPRNPEQSDDRDAQRESRPPGTGRIEESQQQPVPKARAQERSKQTEITKPSWWRGMTGPDWVTAIATVMIFLATAAYAWYARRQWQAMDNELAAMQNQIAQMKSDTTAIVNTEEGIANKSLDQAQKSFRESFEATISHFQLQQRAWVGVSPPKIVPYPGGIEIRGEIVNTGKTPAFEVQTFLPGAEAECCNLREGFERLNPKFLSPRGTLPPGGTMPFSVALPSRPPFKAGTRITIRGTIRYEDAFNTKHWTNFCLNSMNGAAFTFCPCCNDTDEHPEHWPKSGLKSFGPN